MTARVGPLRAEMVMRFLRAAPRAFWRTPLVSEDYTAVGWGVWGGACLYRGLPALTAPTRAAYEEAATSLMPVLARLRKRYKLHSMELRGFL